MGPRSPSSVFQSLSSDSQEPDSCPKGARLPDPYSSALLSLQQRRNPYEQRNEFQNQTHPLFALSGFQNYSSQQVLIAQKPQIRHSRILEICRFGYQKSAIAMEAQSSAAEIGPDLKPDSPSIASSGLPQIFALLQQRIDSLQSIVSQISQTPPPFGRDAQLQLAAAAQISSAISQLVLTAASIALPPSFSSDLNPSLDLSQILGIGTHFLDSPIRANLGLQSGGYSPFDSSADVGIAQFVDFQENSLQGLELGVNEELELCQGRAAAARGQNEQGIKEEEEDGEIEILPPGSYDLIEMDAMEILAEHTHFCEICGKGFKRDANLRMHMRGHGDEYKSPAALARPQGEKNTENHLSKQKRFSCPFEGCKRNKKHKKFQPLKTVLCVKNHYRRTHCPKILICSKCKIKRFSVVADLKTHEKHCGKEKWQCSCGTTFSRKDKLIGHLSLFEGHLPAPGLLDLDHQINQVSNNTNSSSSALDLKSSSAAVSGFNADLGSAWRLNTAYHNSDLLGLNTCNEAAESVINTFPDLFSSNLLHGMSK